jgi:serine phosphatase RsbU (regulator of sigma subunit)/anti-sigma regulatory factor (Ser/Thr protein kinase)
MPTEIAASRPSTLRLTVACDLREVRPAAQEVAAFLAAHGCNGDEMTACGLALVEACNNAIQYAPSESRSSPIRIEVCITDDIIECRVADRTQGFEWPKEISLPEPGSESGRGLFIIHSVSDQAGYLRGQDQNVLFFRHARTSRPSDNHQVERDAILEQMVEELSSCYESLAAIFRHSAATHEAAQLKTFAQNLLQDVQRIVGADWFVLRLASADQAALNVFAQSHNELELQPIALAWGEGAAASPEAQAVASRRPVWFDGSPASSPQSPTQAESSGMVHPIFSGDTLVGTLAIGRHAASGAANPLRGPAIFTASQTNVISTLTDFLAIQVVKARFHEEQMAAHATARELEIAHHIQSSLLLKELPRLSGIQLVAHCENARQVGGDFYDVLPAGEDALLLVIADVMGKGIPAALFAATLRTALRASPELFTQPAKLLQRANQLLFEELSSVDMFITAQVALLSTLENRLVVASAGHCPLLFHSEASPECQAIAPDGLPLGVRKRTAFEEFSLSLPRQFALLLCTDGLSEAANAEGRHYGQQRLERWFAPTAATGGGAAAIRRDLIVEMHRFRGDLPLSDDQTFLVATRNPES